MIYKIRHDLTLNLGLRYDIDTPRNEAHAAQSNLDLSIPMRPPVDFRERWFIRHVLLCRRTDYASVQGGTYLKDFGPHVGFAYAPTELFGRIRNIVFRGGYGIYYAALFYDDLRPERSNSAAGPPFSRHLLPRTVLTRCRRSRPVSLPTLYQKIVRILRCSNGQNVGYIANSYGRPARTQNWSFEIQKELTKDLILSLGYVGVKRRLPPHQHCAGQRSQPEVLQPWRPPEKLGHQR